MAQKNLDFPGNVCLQLGGSRRANGVPGEEDVLNAIEQIESSTNREILLAVFRDGKTLREIGCQMGLSAERVRQRRNLALRSLRDILFPRPQQVYPSDLPILPENNPLRSWHIPFESAISLSKSKTHTLHTYGYHSIADICAAGINDLCKLNGIGLRSAGAIADEIHALDEAQALSGNTETIKMKIPDLQENVFECLYFYGFHYIGDFSRMTPNKIASLTGISESAADKIRSAIQKAKRRKQQ